MSPRLRFFAWGALPVLAALALRLAVLAWSPGAPYDMESYTRAAACVGPGLYTLPALAGRYPYLPLWWMVLRALRWPMGLLGGGPGFWFRLPALIGDAAISGLAYLWARRRTREKDLRTSERAGLLAGLSWALNPLAVLVSAGHGQFDSLALGAVLGAAYLLSGLERREAWAAACLAAAVALKTWPLAFLPLCLAQIPGRRRQVRFAAAVCLAPLCLLLPWLWTDGFGAVAARLSYTGAEGLGLPGALKACFFAAHLAPALWRETDACYRALALAALGGAFVWALLRREALSRADSLAWVALTLVLLAPGLSPQYLLWAPALALAAGPGRAWRLSLGALPLALGFYALFMPVVLAGPDAWAPPAQSPGLICAWGAANVLWWFWTLLEWKRLRALHPVAARGFKAMHT